MKINLTRSARRTGLRELLLFWEHASEKGVDAPCFTDTPSLTHCELFQRVSSQILFWGDQGIRESNYGTPDDFQFEPFYGMDSECDSVEGFLMDTYSNALLKDLPESFCSHSSSHQSIFGPYIL